MSCLLCLRNEGIILSNESSNDFEILLNLLKLPQEFSDNLLGNQCCSLCRVKLQFVGVINNEIRILSEKLKYFEEEVKEIFVSSFNRDENSIESDGNAIDARNKLLNELNIPFIIPQYEEDNSTPEEFQNLSLKIEPIESSFDHETESSDNFISQTKHLEQEAVNSSVDDNAHIEHHDDQFFQISSSSISESESTQFAPFHSFPLTHSSHPIPSTSSETRSINLENTRKRKRSCVNINLSTISHHLPEHLAVTVTPKRSFQIYVCNICPTKKEFNQIKDYEIHLRTFHRREFYSKCSEYNNTILEKMKDSVHTVHSMSTHCGNEKSDKTRSEMWKHFSLVKINENGKNQTRAKCNLCSVSYLYEGKSKSTGNMRIHLKKHLNTNNALIE